MKTKLFTLLLAVAASVGTMFASDIQVDGIWYDFDSSSKTASVTFRGSSYDSYSDEYTNSVVIPASVTYNSVSYSVTSIGSCAFFYCRSLTSVTIPNSVTNIGIYAFAYCSSLTSIDIPNSVTSIGVDAFYKCTGLTSPVYNAHVFAFMPTSYSGAYTIPDGIESIAGSAFNGRTGLTSVTIPNSVTSIGDRAFKECESLTSITIPNSVTSIGDRAFEYCSGLTSPVYNAHVFAFMPTSYSGAYTIPDGIESIAGGAFLYCRSLTSVTIPNSVTSIGDEAFEYCSGLTSPVYNAHVFAFMPTSYSGAYTIPDGIESIAGSAFNGCTGLTSVTIPNSVTSIGNYAFEGCKSLTSVTIPNSVTSIGNFTFYYCTNLKNVIIGSSVKVLETGAFVYCSSIESFTCYSQRPPTVNEDALYGLDYRTIIYVPADYLETYRMHDAWGLYDVRPLGAKSTETTDVNVTPAENTAEVAWPAVSGAATYELVIKDKSGNVICTLIFNAQGQLTQIAFNAPSRNNAPQQTQAAGFSFTVTGLENGTSYDLTITSKDNNGGTLDTKTVSFTTTGEQGLEDVQSDNVQCTKVLINGQTFILRGDRTYTVTGQELR